MNTATTLPSPQSPVPNPQSSPLIRPNVAALHPYVPGEQPQEPGWIKLNTNENPFLAPRIAEAVAAAATDALRLYPDPRCVALRDRLSERYGVPASQIICGNGSDELLTLAVRVAAGEGDRIVFPDPTYSLYVTLARIQNAVPLPVSMGPNWELPVDELAAGGGRLTMVASPNAPTGTPYRLDEIERLARRVEGLLVVDEAYVDFGGETALPLIGRYEHVVVLRTMSKAFGLAGVRLGYAFGSPAVIDALYRIKDSYNVGRLAQVAGIAALDAYDEAMANNRQVAARRDRLAALLRDRFGWQVWDSAANFLLAAPLGHAQGDPPDPADAHSSGDDRRPTTDDRHSAVGRPGPSDPWRGGRPPAPRPGGGAGGPAGDPDWEPSSSVNPKPKIANPKSSSVGGRLTAREIYDGLKARRVLVRHFERPRLAGCLRISIGSEAEMAAFVRALDGLLR